MEGLHEEILAVKLDVQVEDRYFSIEISNLHLESGNSTCQVKVSENGKLSHFAVEVLDNDTDRLTLRIGSRVAEFLIHNSSGELLVDWNNRSYPANVLSAQERLRTGKSAETADGPTVLKAQMPGKVIRILANEGEDVEKGQGMVVIEAMKMQNEVKSPRAGRVLRCSVREGATVNSGDLLYEIS